MSDEKTLMVGCSNTYVRGDDDKTSMSDERPTMVEITGLLRDYKERGWEKDGQYRYARALKLSMTERDSLGKEIRDLRETVIRLSREADALSEESARFKVVAFDDRRLLDEAIGEHGRIRKENEGLKKRVEEFEEADRDRRDEAREDARHD